MNDAVVVKESKIQGRGLFAGRDFVKNEKVYEYEAGRLVKIGEVSSLSVYDRDHMDTVDEDTFEIMKPPACHINHSCDPNIIEDKDSRIGYALRPIEVGEELTIDYRIRSAEDWRFDCHCGAKNCSGIVIGNYFTLPIDLQKKYLPYAPKFIREEYKKKH